MSGQVLLQAYKLHALVEEQKADSELNSLRQTALPESQVEDVAEGLFLKDDVLLRKWHT